MRKEKIERTYTPEQLQILNDLSITRDIASMLTDLPQREINDYRFRIRYREVINKAAKRYRDKKKAENLERLGGRKYDYWTAEDIEYILTSEDTDEEMAIKLGRTTYAIQKKREREIKKGL